MNAKKISTLLLCSAGIAMLAACSGKTVTRADAITNLNAMDAVVNGTSFVAPTKVTVEATASKAVYNHDSYFGYKKYLTASSISTSAGSTAVTANTEYWAYMDDASTAVVAYNDGTNKVYAKITLAETISLVKSAIDADIAAQVKTMKGSPKSISTYLASFSTLTNTSVYSSVTVGGTAAGKKVMGIKAETYASSGSGNLDAKWTSVYPAETPTDEPLEYKYNNSMLTYSYNGKFKTSSTYTWNTAAVSKIGSDFTVKTSITDVAAIYTIVLAAI